MNNRSIASDSPSHSQKPLTLEFLIKKGIDFAKKTFWSVIPLSLLMSMIGYAIQPNTVPLFSEWTDWIALLLLALGVLVLSALHAALLIRMNAIVHGQSLGLKEVIELGMNKSLAVFLVWLLYISLILAAILLFIKTNQLDLEEIGSYSLLLPLIGLVFFILPVVFLSVSFYLALFIVVLAEYKHETSWYKKIINYYRESIILLRGQWWKMFGLLLLFSVVMAIIEGICQLILKEFVVIAVLFYVIARAAILPFWYGCILAMILELKAKKNGAVLYPQNE